MPIYEYVCSACSHRTEILHGVHDAGPHFCPECGTEGTMRKAFAPPAIVFKGTGWAKKERRSATAPAKSSGSDSPDGGGKAEPTKATGTAASSGGGGTDD